LLHTCLRPWRHREDYRDLVQEGSIALLLALRGYDPGRGRFSSYAWRAIRNAILHYLATQDDEAADSLDAIETDGQALLDGLADPGPALDELVLARIEGEDALARMDARTRLVVRLHAEDYTYREIGQRLGVSRARCWQIHSEARAFASS